MKILHFSDLHGRHTQTAQRLIQTHAPDWIVLTGDILPDFYMVSGRESRLSNQRAWWESHRTSFLAPGAVTTLTLGNHELEGFRAAQDEGVPADLAGQVGVLQGVPEEFGAWGFAREMGTSELQKEVERMGAPKVVLTHCPPYGWLDANNRRDHIGHRPLRAHIEDGVDQPLLVLCGHVHESFGELRKGRTLLVNASAGFALLDLDLRRGVALVLEMHRLQEGEPLTSVLR